MKSFYSAYVFHNGCTYIAHDLIVKWLINVPMEWLMSHNILIYDNVWNIRNDMYVRWNSKYAHNMLIINSNVSNVINI